MYVRPETLTLLYLSIFLAIIFRWDEHPGLAWFLPLVQVAWVNSQGLFVLGPIVLGFALFDAALRFGFFTPERRRGGGRSWPRVSLTGAACLINPYFITGALYPLELAGTMSNPIFSQEHRRADDDSRLHPEHAGLWNLPIQLHFATMILGALSFLDSPVSGWYGEAVREASLCGGGRNDSARHTWEAPMCERNVLDRNRRGQRSAQASTQSAATVIGQPAGWRLSPFRLLLYTAFSFLSLQATRNSHQFAAVVGTVTAWNFGEWAAAVRQRRLARQSGRSEPPRQPCPRLRRLRRGRPGSPLGRLGPLLQDDRRGARDQPGRGAGLFPHEAARFAGEPGMPERFLSFHNGHASLFEYYHGPERKVYTDPRLEVAGADLFETIHRARQATLEAIEPGWEVELDEMGRPVIMVDHEHNWEIGATLLRSSHWRCVWFDAIVAVFVHDS